MSNNNGIFDCGKDKAVKGCDEEVIPGSCKTIEDSFIQVWNEATQAEKEELEGIWSTVMDKVDAAGKPLVTFVRSDIPRTLEGICGTRMIVSEEGPKEVSACDRATGYIRAFTEYEDYANTIFGKGPSENCTDPSLCGYWNMHTGQKDCRFRDQDYGYGYDNPDHNKTPKKICEAINEKKEVLVNEFKVGNINILDTSPYFYEMMLDTWGASSTNNIINNISVTLEPKTMVEQRNECKNLFTGNLSNKISAKCDLLSDVNALNTLLTSNDIVMTPELLMELTQMKITNIVQSNTVESMQNCQMANTMDGLLQMNATIDNQAFQSAISEAKGTGTGASSGNTVCNDIDITMSPCVYVNQTNCCANKIEVISDNNIQAGCNSIIDNVIQDNKITKLQACNALADTTLSTQLASEVFNTTTQVAESKATATNYTVVIIFLLIMVAGAMYVYVRYMKKYAIVGIILGVISILVGVGFIYLFFKNRITRGTIYQDPYSVCDGCKTDLSKKMSWGAAKTLFEASGEYLALDFFPDNYESDERTIKPPPEDDEDVLDGPNQDAEEYPYTFVDYKNLPDDWSGLAVFMAEPNRDGNCLGLCSKILQSDERCPRENKVYSITKNKTLQDFTILGIGIGFFLVGLILAIISIIMMMNTPSDTATDIVYSTDIFTSPRTQPPQRTEVVQRTQPPQRTEVIQRTQPPQRTEVIQRTQPPQRTEVILSLIHI